MLPYLRKPSHLLALSNVALSSNPVSLMGMYSLEAIQKAAEVTGTGWTIMSWACWAWWARRRRGPAPEAIGTLGHRVFGAALLHRQVFPLWFGGAAQPPVNHACSASGAGPPFLPSGKGCCSSPVPVHSEYQWHAAHWIDSFRCLQVFFVPTVNFLSLFKHHLPILPSPLKYFYRSPLFNFFWWRL